jgi:hypothetical protein
MLLKFWQNPEFIRHCRSELRRSRMTTVALVVLFVCGLAILGSWATERAAEQPNHRSLYAEHSITVATAREGYYPMMLMQFGVLTFWSLLSCTLGISRERERNTWDFQRTTRLLPSELLIGKLLGEPVLAYFIFLCVLPVTLVTGIIGHVPLLKILLADFVTLIAAIFIGIAGLWVSSLFENRSRGIGLIAGLAVYGIFLAPPVWPIRRLVAWPALVR